MNTKLQPLVAPIIMQSPGRFIRNPDEHKSATAIRLRLNALYQMVSSAIQMNTNLQPLSFTRCLPSEAKIVTKHFYAKLLLVSNPVGFA